MLDELEGQAVGSTDRSVGMLRVVASEVWAEVVAGEEGSVPGVDSIVEVNMSEVVLSGSVEEEVLMESDVLITGLAVVSARVVKDSTESSVVVVEGGTLGGEVLPVSSDVLDSSGVEASVSGLEERRVAVAVESVVGSSVELSIGVEEVGRDGDTVAVTPMTVVSRARCSTARQVRLSSSSRSQGSGRDSPPLCPAMVRVVGADKPPQAPL